jgi:hypothetical protein
MNEKYCEMRWIALFHVVLLHHCVMEIRDVLGMITEQSEKSKGAYRMLINLLGIKIMLVKFASENFVFLLHL